MNEVDSCQSFLLFNHIQEAMCWDFNFFLNLHSVIRPDNQSHTQSSVSNVTINKAFNTTDLQIFSSSDILSRLAVLRAP